MRAEAYKICLACDARNRARWEFCVKCGESLHDVEAIEPGLELGAVRVSPLTAGAGLLTVVAAAFLGGWITSRLWPIEPAAGPDFSVFASLAKPTRRPPPGQASSPPPGAEAARAGRELLLDGDNAAALEQLRKALAAAPDDPQVHNLYAHALWREGDLDGALDAFRRANQLGDERTLRLQADLANALAASGRPTEAIQELERLAQESPRSPGTFRLLGQLYFETGRQREAADAMSQALRLEPDNPGMQEQLGYVLEQAGRQEEALAAYRRAAELAPSDGGKLIRLAEAVGRQDPEQGISVLREGVERNPEQAMLQQRLGVALEKAGRRSEAVAAYREYLKLRPDAPDASKVADRARYLEEGGGGGGR